MPNQDKKLFSRPYSGLSTHKNSMALATMGTTVGRLIDGAERGHALDLLRQQHGQRPERPTRPMGMPMKDMTAVFLIDTGKYLSLNSVT